LILLLIKHKQEAARILAEVNREIVQPQLQTLVDAGKLAKGGSTADVDYLSLINFENIGNLEFYSHCLNEGLRY